MSIFTNKHYIWFRNLLLNEELQIDIDQVGQLLAAFTKDNKDFDPDIILSPFRKHYDPTGVNKLMAEVIKFPTPPINLDKEGWIKTYNPIPNMFNSDTSYLSSTEAEETINYSFETYGYEVDFVKKQSNNHIWTLVDSENGWAIYSGFIASTSSNINHIAYFVTAVPWSNDMVINYNIED
tara:strand:+ start:216 stop:755 length:540 start_codon:yes stop_codon:yes gene_type:complete